MGSIAAQMRWTRKHLEVMQILKVMVVLFIIVVLGYVARKLNYMNDTFDKKLSCIVIDITMPLLVLSSAMGRDVPDRTMMLPLIGVGVVTYIVLLSFGFLVPRLLSKSRDEQGMIGFTLMFANVSFIGYYVVESIFGTKGLFYSALLNVPYFFFIFTIGIMLIKGNCHLRQFDFKVLVSPVMIAIYVAALLVAFNVNTPNIVARPVVMVGGMTVPAALMLIGSSMAKMPLKEVVGRPKAYVTTVIRLIVVPLCLYCVFRLLGVRPLINEINTVLVATPAASVGTMFCLKYDRDPSLVTSITFLSILGCIVTIPLLDMIF